MERDEVADDRKPDEPGERRDDGERPRGHDRAVVAGELRRGDPREGGAEREPEERRERDGHRGEPTVAAGRASTAATRAPARARYRGATLAPIMDPARIRQLLEGVRRGATSVDDAVAELKDLPYADLGYAAVDHHRALRQGSPEVVFGPGKTAEQIVGIARELARTGQNVLVTRLEADQGSRERRRVAGAPLRTSSRGPRRSSTRRSRRSGRDRWRW